ncbi:MAG: 2-oxo-3-hexenedioate decarboxylase [Salinisphaeraceae bacterium]|jgi:2-oxo-3-hexenedioate decarboxylase|nr:2-oxo-3-hexenedioate decarboxylase [Salinisphaeraceae bacterium]
MNDSTTRKNSKSVTLSEPDIDSLADRVLQAQDAATPIGKLTLDYPDMTIADGYEVQKALRARWVARGERVLGFKAGLTSRAKMEQMGVDAPGFGILTSAMARPENSAISVTDLIHPRVEAELAFMMKDELSGSAVSVDDVLAATDYVIPALEIIDSRFEQFKFDLESVIADNCSSARFVTGGRPMNVDQLDDLRTLGVVIEKNGNIEEMAATAAVLNHPANAIIEIVRHLHAHGESLPAGSLILTGGVTAAIPAAAGDSMVARYQHLGSISVRFVV